MVKNNLFSDIVHFKVLKTYTNILFIDVYFCYLKIIVITLVLVLIKNSSIHECSTLWRLIVPCFLQAYEYRSGGDLPKFTLIVAQKNHRTKLFRAGSTNDTVPPGLLFLYIFTSLS